MAPSSGATGSSPRAPAPGSPSRTEVVKPLRLFGWFIIGTLYGMKDRKSDLRATMLRTLDRLAEMTEAKSESAAS